MAEGARTPQSVNPHVMYDVFAPMALKDRVAIITGGGTGLGLAIATEYARVGARLVLAARKLDRLEQAAEGLRALGARVLPVACDVRDRAAVEAMVAATTAEFGRLDILVNNAGARFDTPSESLSKNGWLVINNIVLNGTWHCSQEAARVMIPQGGGTIINIVSNSPWLGSVYAVHSAAAKTGVWALTRTLAAEWRPHNIRVSGIAPYAPVGDVIDRSSLPPGVDMHSVWHLLPLGRPGLPQEVAWAAVFLASAAGAGITGHTMDLTGASWLGRRPEPAAP